MISFLNNQLFQHFFFQTISLLTAKLCFLDWRTSSELDPQSAVSKSLNLTKLYTCTVYYKTTCSIVVPTFFYRTPKPTTARTPLFLPLYQFTSLLQIFSPFFLPSSSFHSSHVTKWSSFFSRGYPYLLPLPSKAVQNHTSPQHSLPSPAYLDRTQIERKCCLPPPPSPSTSSKKQLSHHTLKTWSAFKEASVSTSIYSKQESRRQNPVVILPQPLIKTFKTRGSHDLHQQLPACRSPLRPPRCTFWRSSIFLFCALVVPNSLHNLLQQHSQGQRNKTKNLLSSYFNICSHP